MTSDYRNSHLTKGTTYNEILTNDPMDNYMTRMETSLMTSILRDLGDIPRSLDFACGTGRLTKTIEKYATESLAIDISQSMVERAKKTCNKTTFFVADISKEPIDMDPVNLITSFRFFGNAQDELRIAVLEVLYRYLVPGGYLVINNHRNPWAISSLCYSLIGEGEGLDLSYLKLKSLLQHCGYTIRDTYGIGWWIVRSKFKTQAILTSRFGRLLETLSSYFPIIQICPDMIIVAQKPHLHN